MICNVAILFVVCTLSNIAMITFVLNANFVRYYIFYDAFFVVV